MNYLLEIIKIFIAILLKILNQYLIKLFLKVTLSLPLQILKCMNVQIRYWSFFVILPVANVTSCVKC